MRATNPKTGGRPTQAPAGTNPITGQVPRYFFKLGRSLAVSCPGSHSVSEVAGVVRCTPSTGTSSRCFDRPLASSTGCLLIVSCSSCPCLRPRVWGRLGFYCSVCVGFWSWHSPVGCSRAQTCDAQTQLANAEDVSSAPRAPRRRSRTLFPFCHDGSIGCVHRCPGLQFSWWCEPKRSEEDTLWSSCLFSSNSSFDGRGLWHHGVHTSTETQACR